MKKKIAEKIRQARVIRNLSQENIAMELGISAGAYSNIERGKSEVTVSRLYAIAKILKITVAEILSDKDEISFGRSSTKEYTLPVEKNYPELNDLKEQLIQLKKEVTSLKNARSKKSRHK